jgi:hypothetical protein
MLTMCAASTSALAGSTTGTGESSASSLRRAAGAYDPEPLAHLLERLGPLTSVDIESDVDESGRSALHHACWRGALRSVERLLDMGCDVNIWSTGTYSMGKTPIFYAVTRCRDSVVSLLLERGARTRILNNKGQSVLSLASSHLDPATIAAIEAAEANEATSAGGGTDLWLERISRMADGERPIVRKDGWLDFLSSHPDGCTYGDLDPRFIGPPAMEALVAAGGVRNRLCVNPTTREGRKIRKHWPGNNQQQQLRSDGRGWKQAAKAAAAVVTASATPSAPMDARKALLTQEVEQAFVAIEALLSQLEGPPQGESRGEGSGDEGGAARAGSGSSSNADADAEAAAAAVDSLVAKLAVSKGAWLPAAATRLGAAASDGRRALLRRAAAVGDAEEGAESEGARRRTALRRRVLLAAAVCPSEEEAAAAAAAAARAKAKAEEAAAARAAAGARAEARRTARVARLVRAPATPPAKISMVSTVEGLDDVRAALARAQFVGIDTEWADGESGRTSDALLATIQLATVEPDAVAAAGGAERAWVIDAMVVDDPCEESRQYAAALASLLRDTLLSAGTPLPVGFAFAADAKVLAAWLLAHGSHQDGRDDPDREAQDETKGDPPLAELCARIRSSTLDVQKLAMDWEGERWRNGQFPSLAATSEHWLCEGISKEEQCSNWSARPLRPEQVVYAALDASACLRLLAAMREDWEGGTRAGDDGDGSLPALW